MGGKHKEYPVGSYGWRKRHLRHRKPFAGVDGEGGNIWGPNPEGQPQAGHHYFYMRAGAHELYNQDGAPLSTEQCLTFLADLPRTATYVAFFFDYDVTMMLRDLSQERVGKLLHPSYILDEDGNPKLDKTGRPMTFAYLSWRGFEISYMPGKEFRVRRANTTGYAVVSDVGSFFQCTFVRALHEWLGEWDGTQYVIRDERDARIVELIAQGKEQRNEFTGLTEYIREYCRLEVEQLARVMEKFRGHCDALGLRPTRWQGPGFLVSSAMRQNNFPKRVDYEEKVPGRVWSLANAAYYGGRFEAPIIGEIGRPVHQYDINSAYAASYRRLPCLVHGEWRQLDPHSTNFPHYTICRVRYKHTKPVFVCGLPRRDKHGSISFPLRGNGVYWWHELASPVQSLKLNILEAWGYFPHCDCKPFNWIDDLYNKRIEVGKKSGLGGVLKLVLASTYGKLCQSVGSPQYSNPIWASLITSMVRTWLLEAALQDGRDGSDVVMLATDGLFTLDERQLPISSEIGEWEHDTHSGMFVIQSGLYFLPDAKIKSRGIPAKNIQGRREDIRTEWSRWFTQAYERGPIPLSPEPPRIPIRQRRFISLTQAHAWRDVTRAGQWPEDDRQLTFDWSSKRIEHGYRKLVVDRAVRTIPLGNRQSTENIPYSRDIGGFLPDKLTRREIDQGQPDWNFFQI
jgi:hypothetical protein